ncbi:MAG: hypoxanthine phosphoribosyltransferase [Clostridiales bacterium]|nr:hypoxanthine phosphoribosyltransferase [Clostridiales bacterium]MCD8109714.1 hypoxanthine phosphoribosyltransferase [Clostridiales bacterium]MCD8132522.1 hypoxanthine phosphoribosyltransferase [Clostridiales bacterium]
MDGKIHVMYSEEQIDARIRELGAAVSADLNGEPVHLVCVLKGASFFACELAKRMTVPVYMDFMCVSSYGNDTRSSGEVRIVKDLDDSVEGKHVLIAEDIIDSGNTLHFLLEEFQKRGAADVRICALLSKPDRRETEVPADYIGYVIPDVFVVGYGLDYAQQYRNLPYIGVLDI